MNAPFISSIQLASYAYEIIGEFRGKGLMLGVEVVKTNVSKAPAPTICRLIRQRCADNDLIVGAGGF